MFAYKKYNISNYSNNFINIRDKFVMRINPLTKLIYFIIYFLGVRPIKRRGGSYASSNCRRLLLYVRALEIKDD